jgi:hypothetical protein
VIRVVSAPCGGDIHAHALAEAVGDLGKDGKAVRADGRRTGTGMAANVSSPGRYSS